MRKALDLFSGRRTALVAFDDWDVTHIDIIDGNPIQDFCPDHIYDFIWASPPCQEYSRVNARARRRIPNRTLWYETFRVIDRAKRDRGTPWVIENVSGAQYWFGRAKDNCCNAWYFWGFYPKVKLPIGLRKDTDWINHTGKSAAARAMIPYEISEAFYKAVSK